MSLAGDRVPRLAPRSPPATCACLAAKHPTVISFKSTVAAAAWLGKALQDSFFPDTEIL